MDFSRESFTDFDWFLWRPIFSNIATLGEMKTSWSLYDVCLANDLLGFKMEIDQKNKG